MQFIVAQAALGEFRWTLFGASRARRAAAVSIGYRRAAGCRTAAKRIRAEVARAPIVDKSVGGSIPTGGRLYFLLEKGGRGEWRWALKARRKTLAVSGRDFVRKRAALDVIASVQGEAPSASVDDLVGDLWTFAPDPVPAKWGQSVTLRALGVTDFGQTQGSKKVYLRYGADPLERLELKVESGGWQPKEVKVLLPATPPSKPPPYVVAIDGLALPCEGPLLTEPAIVTEIAGLLDHYAKQVTLARASTSRSGWRRSPLLGTGEELPLALHKLPPARLELASGQSIRIHVDATWMVDGVAGSNTETFIRSKDQSPQGFLEKTVYQFVPEPGRLTQSAEQQREVQVRVKLEAAGVTKTLDPTKELAPLLEFVARVHRLQIPSVAALYDHRDFGQPPSPMDPAYVSLINPDTVAETTVIQRLNTLFASVQAFQRAFGAAYWLRGLGEDGTLVADLEKLGSDLRGQQLRAAVNPVRDMSKIKYHDWYDGSNTTSSFLLVGLPNDWLAVCNDTEFRTSDGALLYRLPPGRILMKVRYLRSEAPEAEPPCLTIRWPAPGRTFNDTISSAKFGSEPIPLERGPSAHRVAEEWLRTVTPAAEQQRRRA